jgi:hypothetical protein
MLAGEKFTDRPDCVCPVIGSFLRSWNDQVGYADRQRLYPYASRVVDTGGYRRISRIRRDLCLSHAGADLDRGPLRRAATRLRMRGRIAWTVGIFPAIWLKEGAGAYAAHVCFMRGDSESAFALLDRLLTVESPPSSPVTNGNGNGNGNGHRDAELATRAAVVARSRSRAARGSDSAPAEAEDRRPERQAAQLPEDS